MGERPWLPPPLLLGHFRISQKKVYFLIRPPFPCIRLPFSLYAPGIENPLFIVQRAEFFFIYKVVYSFCYHSYVFLIEKYYHNYFCRRLPAWRMELQRWRLYSRLYEVQAQSFVGKTQSIFKTQVLKQRIRRIGRFDRKPKSLSMLGDVLVLYT